MARRLSHHEYEQSKQISARGYQFYALLAALMRQADTENTALLKECWPDIWESLQRRYDAPMGVIEEWDGFTAEAYYESLHSEGDEDDN
jgi:hypothetical protein